MHPGHANIHVRNVAAAHAWYTRVLGLHTYQLVPGGAAFLSANIESSHEIALVEVGPDAPGQVPKQVGLNHIAWMVDTLDEPETLYNTRSPSITVAFCVTVPTCLHGWGEADEHGIAGNDVGFVGVFIAGGEDADPALVHPGTGGDLGGCISGWPARTGAAQDGLDAR